MTEHETNYLTTDDRRWLRAHGWTPPPPAPQWDADAQELVITCPDCSARLVCEHVDLMMYSSAEPVGRHAVNAAEVLAQHARQCEETPDLD
jgi:hypothetical protein